MNTDTVQIATSKLPDCNPTEKNKLSTNVYGRIWYQHAGCTVLHIKVEKTIPQFSSAFKSHCHHHGFLVEAGLCLSWCFFLLYSLFYSCLICTFGMLTLKHAACLLSRCDTDSDPGGLGTTTGLSFFPFILKWFEWFISTSLSWNILTLV